MADSSGDPLCGISPDEIGLVWGNEPLPMALDDFARKLFDKILEGVCNVVRTA